MNIILGRWRWQWGAPREAGADTIFLNLWMNRVIRNGVTISVAPHEFRMLTLFLASPVCLSRDELMGALYSDREDGGPLSMRMDFDVYIWRLRQRMRAIGIQIENRRGWGWKAVLLDMPARDAA